MKTKDLIWKVIMGTAVVLTMLPVQARADSCSHTLEYTADRNALVETCTQECGYEEKAWLAMDSEAPLVYNGGEMKPLKVEYTEGWQGGELTIVYDNNVEASTEDVKASGSISMEIAGPEDEKEIITAVETFAIARAAMNVTAVPYTAAYDGQPHGITLEGLPANAAVTYCATEDGEYSDVPMTQKDVGSITVWYKVAADNYHDISGSATVEIIPRELTVTAEAEMTYGEEVPEIQPSYEGFAAGEDVSVLTGAPVLSHGYVQFMDAGSYEIQVSAADMSAGNYTVTEKNGTLTVKPRELTVVWDATTFTYDSEVHKPKATVSGMVNGDEILCTAEGEGTEAGTYPAKITITGEKSGNYCLPDNGEIQFVIEKAPQTAPENLTTVQESILNIGDGQITGVTAEMEYKRKGAEGQYTPVSGTEVTGLTSGTYLVRYAEKANHAASADAEVTVTAVKALRLIVPEDQEGYTLTVDHAEVGWAEDAKITFVLDANYEKTDKFAVKANGKVIKIEADNTGDVLNIQKDIHITVEGIERKITAEFGGETYTAVTDNVTFETYLNRLTLKVGAPDGAKIEYSEQSAATDPASIESWKTYDGIVTFSGAERKVVCYVKVTKASGEVVYVSTDGVVYDPVVPVVNIRGGENYVSLTITAEDITETNLDRITVDGTPMQLPVTLAGNVDKDYRIVAYDKAGNKSVTKTVNMAPISKLENSAESYTADSVTAGNRSAIQSLLNKVKKLDGTAAEEALLKPIEDYCNMLLAVIEIKEIAKPIDSLTKDNMKPENRETVQEVQSEIEKMTGKTDEEKDLLSELKEKCEELLDNIHYSITTKTTALEWIKGSKDDLKIKTDAEGSTLTNVRIDGKILAKTYYSYDDGTLSLKASYLQKTTVTVGKHTIKLEFEDGDTGDNTSINILKAGSNPRTGDDSHLMIWCLAAGFSGAGLVAATWADRKRRHQA